MSRIYSRASWGARYRDGVGNRPVGSLEKYLHHSVTRHLPESASIAQERVECRTVERIGQQRFGAGISYTFLIFPSGRIHQGASVGRISYHSGGGRDGRPRNTLGVGICLVGNYQTKRPTAAQLSAIVWLLQEGVRRGWWGDPAITQGHRDFKATSCPGQYAYAQIDSVNKRGRGDNVTVPPKPKPKTPPASGGGRSVSAMATEVINGQHGNGHANRRRSLGISAATYAKVRAEVNRRLAPGSTSGSGSTSGGGRSVSAMATEVIRGAHGNGHANRRRSLGISAAEYARVRAEVNRRLS